MQLEESFSTLGTRARLMSVRNRRFALSLSDSVFPAITLEKRPFACGEKHITGMASVSYQRLCSSVMHTKVSSPPQVSGVQWARLHCISLIENAGFACFFCPCVGLGNPLGGPVRCT